MSVYELTYEELYELKEALYYGADILPEMTAEQQQTIEEALDLDDIPDEIVYELFAGYAFTPEDFFVNC